ncbi:MAG: ABC transporter substrate-binding protein [Emcibacteraceae bacterium]
MRHLIYPVIFLLLNAQTALAQEQNCQTAGQRVIALGGAVTEMIYALGEEKRLVGVDITSTYPASALKLPKVGYYRTVSAEGLMSLGPDLIIADPDAGPPEVLDQLKAIGICIRKIGGGGSADAVLDRVALIADILNAEGKGNTLRKSLSDDFAEATVRSMEIASEKPRVLFLLSAQDGTPVAAGIDTDANAIIHLAGGVNAVDGFSGYKPLSSEVAAASKADFILMMSHVVESSGGPSSILNLPQIRLTPAGRLGNLISMDGLLLLGFGPRTPEAINSLSNQIYK